MEVFIYCSEDQWSVLDVITDAVKKELPNFKWSYISDLEEFKAKIGVFKIFANGGSCDFDVDLLWLQPSSFIKIPKRKEAVWNDIVEKVYPAIEKKVKDRAPLNLTDFQLQKIMSMITDSSIGFHLVHPETGSTIGVNSNFPYDVNLTSGDLASMLAAAWLFNAGAVTLN